MKRTLTLTIQTLDEIIADIKYLNRTIKTTGLLARQSNDRYQLNNIELSSGMLVEILDDDFDWRLTRIEHSGDFFTLTTERIDDCDAFGCDAIKIERTNDYYAVALGKGIAECRLRM